MAYSTLCLPCLSGVICEVIEDEVDVKPEIRGDGDSISIKDQKGKTVNPKE